MPVQFTLPPDNRAVGTVDPPNDVNNVIRASNALGAGLSPLSAVFAGGADPAGVADSTAALNAWLAALANGAGHGTWPAGTYKTSAPLVVPAGANFTGA